MKTRLVIGILLLIAVTGGYFFLKDSILSISFFQPKYLDIATIIITSLIVTYIIARITDIIFLKAFSKFLKHDSLGKKLLPLVHNVIIIVIWTLSIITTINLLGFNIATLLTGAGIGGVIFALAGKEAASNLFGSLALVFSKSFKPGDIIRIKGMEGTVEEITLSYTQLTDKRGNVVYIPNKNIVTESIENLTQGKHRKNEIILPLPINLPSKEVGIFIKSLENYGEKKLKDDIFDEYKIMFDSVNSTSQNISFLFQTTVKADIIKLKRDTYLELKEIMDGQKIVFAVV